MLHRRMTVAEDRPGLWRPRRGWEPATGGIFARPGRTVWAIVALALVVRVVLVLGTQDYKPIFDAAEYQQIGESIAAGDGYPASKLAATDERNAFRPPGYPYFLGGIYAVFGDGQTVGRIAGAVVGALTVLLTYLVVRRLWSPQVGEVAALTIAVFPPLVVLQSAVLSDGLFVLLLLAAILTIFRLRDSPTTMGWAVLLGVLCGVAALTRPPGLLFLIPALLGIWTARGPSRGRTLAISAVVVVCAALVVAPWTIRNAIVFGRFIPISTEFGWGVSGTYNNVAREREARWQAPTRVPALRSLIERPGLDEQDLNAELSSRAIDFARAHPGYVARVLLLNVPRLLGITGTHVSKPAFESLAGSNALGRSGYLLVRISTFALLALAVVGAVLGFRSGSLRRIPVFVWVTPVLVLLPALAVLGDPRYRAPADPFLAALAALALVTLWNRLQVKRA